MDSNVGPVSSVVSFFATYGSILAGFVAALGVILGIIAAVSSNRVADYNRLQFERATQVLQTVEKKVGLVIGSDWAPLPVERIDKLREAISSWRKPVQGVHVMYETAFGKALAESIADAFRAADWPVKVGPGSGFERGIVVGWGADSYKMQLAIRTATRTDDVRVVEPEAPEGGLSIVGIGANVRE